MGLRKDILNVPVSKLQLRQLIPVQATTPVREAVDQMRQKRLGCAVVVDQEGRPVGKFTEQLLMKLLLKDPTLLDEPVSRFMHPHAYPVKRDDPIAKLIDLMESEKLRFMCVTDQQGKAVALTGQKGLMEYIVEYFPRQVKVQRMRSKLHMDQREGA